MELDTISKELLSDIFSAYLNSPEGVEALRFRVDNEEFLSEIDQLQSLDFIERRGNRDFIRLLALIQLAGENREAEIMLHNCSLVFDLLRGAYKKNPGKKVRSRDISKSIGYSQDDIGSVLNILVQTSIWGGYSGNHSSENAWVIPSESILKYKSFEDILQETQEQSKRKTSKQQESKQNTRVITKTPVNQVSETPIQLFESLQLHPKVIEVSKDCFITSNYREAILNAFICLIDYVKERTGLDVDGDDLVNQVFSINFDKEQRKITRYPIIRINKLKNQSDRDEQQGFMFLCKGAVGGIRNPKAHKLIPQSNPLHALEYLAFASLLLRRIEEGKIVRTSQSRRRWDWTSFIKDTRKKCEPKISNLILNLFNFTSTNSDSISWGIGTNDGSYTFRKLSINGDISIFSVYSCGWIYVNFGSMVNKTVPDSIIETFRTSLNSIPKINIPKSVITDRKYARIYETILIDVNNLQQFKDAVMSLCRQLENN